MPRYVGTNGNDALVGSAGDDQIIGLGGNDTLTGGTGNDRLTGGTGADALNGGSGVDTAAYDTATAGVVANLRFGSGSGDAAGDTYISIENLVGGKFDDHLRGDGRANFLVGWDGNDNLYGDDGADILSGDAGRDTLQGGTGNDDLRGGAGDDTLLGDQGADLLKGGDGRDIVRYLDSASAVTVNLATGMGQGGDASGDTLSSVEVVVGSTYADTLIGSDGDDVLSACSGEIDQFGQLVYVDTGDNTLYGGAGNDVLIAYSSGNTLMGGAGNDILDASSGGHLFGDNFFIGGDGVDRVSYSGYNGADIPLTVNLAAGSSSAGDILDSIEDVLGSNWDDILIGNAASNTLDGGTGADVLTGGGGADHFRISGPFFFEGQDRATDFSRAQGDKIDLSQITDPSGNPYNLSFIGTGAYTGVAGQVRYALSGSDAVVAADVDGDRVSDFRLVLSNVSSLVASDFVL